MGRMQRTPAEGVGHEAEFLQKTVSQRRKGQWKHIGRIKRVWTE